MYAINTLIIRCWRLGNNFGTIGFVTINGFVATLIDVACDVQTVDAAVDQSCFIGVQTSPHQQCPMNKLIRLVTAYTKIEIVAGLVLVMLIVGYSVFTSNRGRVVPMVPENTQSIPE